MPNTIDAEHLREFFARYGEALATGDLPGISDCYALPSLVVSDEGAIPVLERGEIEAAFDGAAEQHRARGLVAARATVLSSQSLSENLTAVDVRWDYLDEQDHSAERDGYRYVLRTDDSRLRIQVVVARPKLGEESEA